jgi:SAP domain
MFRDSSLILNMQVALIGIVLVVGLFYVWKAISRVESSVQLLSTQICMLSAAPASVVTTPSSMPEMGDIVSEEEAAEAEAFMKHVFGNMMVPPAAAPTAYAPQIIEEEASSHEEDTEEDTEEEPPAVAETQFSKTRLRKMNADGLRETCRELGLPTDGTRAQLLSRLMDQKHL